MPEQMIANLLWFQQLRDPRDAEHLRDQIQETEQTDAASPYPACRVWPVIRRLTGAAGIDYTFGHVWF